jgi:hypothetical protein
MTDAISSSPEWGTEYKEAAAYYRGLLKPLFRGRRWLLFGGPVMGLVHLASELKHLGGERPFLLGSSMGTGELPSDDFAETASFDLEVGSIREEFSRYEALLRQVPDATAQAIDAWDPEGSARAVALIAMSVIPDVAGRRNYAARRAEWLALEDKTQIDEFWHAAGVESVPSEVVDLEEGALRAAIDRLDRGAGAVLSGDARDGIHGGAQSVRPVWSEAHFEAALEALREHHARVRVMPYLEGQPCSIHGVVFPDGVSVFRPVELVTLIDRQPGLFRYAGLGTFWDPSEADRDFMRALARRVGGTLRERVGFRGPFAIDGILCEEGFRPTELNSRFGAGLAPHAFAVPTLPLSSICLAATEGESLDYRPEWLEAVVVEEADRRRSGRGSAWLARPFQGQEMEVHSMVETRDSYRSAEQGESPDATLTIGPGAIGTFLNFVPTPDRVRPGPALAPRVARAFEWADRELGTQIGNAQPARALR